MGIAFAGLAVALGGGCHPDDILKPPTTKILITFDDPACEGQCDPYGANCVFPTYACGVQSCDIDGGTNTLSAQACNGTGKCAAYAPAACPGSLTCADAERCLTSCSRPSDCVTGFTCANGACAPSN